MHWLGKDLYESHQNGYQRNFKRVVSNKSGPKSKEMFEADVANINRQKRFQILLGMKAIYNVSSKHKK